MGKQTISFTIDSDADKDIARWLARYGRGERSAAIRATIRLGLGRGGVTLGDVYQVVKALERRLASGAVMVGVAQGDGGLIEEPPEAAANLDAL